MAVLLKDVHRHRLLEFLAGTKVCPSLARIQYTSLAFQMALLADTVSRAPRQRAWLQDVARRRISDMFLRGSVATLAGDGGQRRGSQPSFIHAAELRRARVTEQTGLRDWPV